MYFVYWPAVSGVISLFLFRGYDGDLHIEDRAFAHPAFQDYGSTHLFHDIVTDPQPEPCSLARLLCRKKGIKDPFLLILGYARPVILDPDVYHRSKANALDFNLAISAYGINGIGYEIHKYLL